MTKQRKLQPFKVRNVQITVTCLNADMPDVCLSLKDWFSENKIAMYGGDVSVSARARNAPEYMRETLAPETYYDAMISRTILRKQGSIESGKKKDDDSTRKIQ